MQPTSLKILRETEDNYSKKSHFRCFPDTANATSHIRYFSVFLNDRIAKIAEVFDLLPSLNNAQAEFALLRFCFSLPKLTYCLRTCDPLHLLPIYQIFDSLQLSSFSLLLGRQLDDAARAQAFLPVKTGGTGLRSAVQHSPAAFIASSAQTRTIVDGILPQRISRRKTDSAFPLLQTHSGNPAYTAIEMLPPDFTQHSLSAEIDAFSRSQLLSDADARQSSPSFPQRQARG